MSLEGPQGAGKSAALFLLVSAWRSLRREGVRVTYVQDAAEWAAEGTSWIAPASTAPRSAAWSGVEWGGVLYENGMGIVMQGKTV